MKKIFYFLFSLFLMTQNIMSQKLVESDLDAKKLMLNESKFLKKPLRELLKEMKPTIKSVHVNQCNHDQSCYAFFVFYFVDLNEKSKLRELGKTPVAVRVYIKEKFEWELSKRPKGREFEWSDEDLEKYGDLKVEGIRVHGDATAEDL